MSKLVYDPRNDRKAKKKSEPSKNISAKTAKTSTETPTETPELRNSELLDLNEETFLAVMQKLGGKDVSTAKMLPFFKIKNDPKPANRWPKLRSMAKKLAKDNKVVITFLQDKREYRYSLPGA